MGLLTLPRRGRRSHALVVPLAIAAALASCSTRDPGDLLTGSEAGLLVVDAVLIVDEELPTVFLSRALDLDDPFASGAAVEVGAGVTIVAGDEEIEYVEDLPGRYVPLLTKVVGPHETYALTVIPRRGPVLRATTTTPARLATPEWLVLDESTQTVTRELEGFSGSEEDVFDANELVYAEGLLEARFDRPDVAAFQVALFSLDPESDYVIDPDFFDEEDFEDLDRVNYSPPLAGSNGRLRLPWFAIFFEGRYKIRIYAVDDNWYDLIRSSPAFGAGQGFGGNAGDSFERPIFRVEGGIGLFGSGSVDSVGFRVLPRP